MKVYAAINQRNQVVKQSNLFNLTAYCRESSERLSIAVFRPNDSHGRIVASFDAGAQEKANVGMKVSADVLGRFDG